MIRSIKHIIEAVIAAAMIMTLLVACGSKADTGTAVQDGMATEDDVPTRDEGVWYAGGLATDESGADIKLALYRLDGDPVAIVLDGGEIYYGEYETAEAKLSDGTEYTLINNWEHKYGYIFNEDNTGYIIDQDGKKIASGALDENTAMAMMDETSMNYEEQTAIGFVEEQSGINEFKDFDDIIAHLKPGQGYAYLKLKGRDDDLLAVTETVFEADDSAYDCTLYGMDDGKPVYMGIVMGNGSAYPLRLEDGILYAGDNHNYDTYFISKEYNSLMMKDSISDGINDGSNEYIGFLRESNDYEHDMDFTGGEKEFKELLAEREKKPIIVFTRVS